MIRPPRHRDEQGQVGLALLVVVVALAAAGLALVFLGEATDQRAGAQKAGDSAANDATPTACARGGGRTSLGVRSAGGGRGGLQATASAVADLATGAVVAISPPARWRRTFTVRLVE